MNPRRVAIIIVAASLALAGCSSSAATGTPSSQPHSSETTGSPSASHPSASPIAPSTETVTSTATVTTTSTPTKSPSTPVVASPADCAGSQLSLRRSEAVGGDSNGGIVLIFTNVSTHTCSLDGYPGAALVDKSGKQFVQARRDLGGMIARCSCSRPQRIALAPGHAASSTLEGNNGGGGECLRGLTALVTAPNTTRSVSVRYTGSFSCDVQIHPVVAGTYGGSLH